MLGIDTLYSWCPRGLKPVPLPGEVGAWRVTLPGALRPGGFALVADPGGASVVVRAFGEDGLRTDGYTPPTRDTFGLSREACGRLALEAVRRMLDAGRMRRPEADLTPPANS